MAVALAVTAVVVLMHPLSATAGPADATATDWAAWINGLRRSHALAPLVVDVELAGLAQRQAQAMADAGWIFHTPDLAAGVSSPWAELGENVGYGRDVAAIWAAFQASPSHLETLLDPRHTHLGIGVVVTTVDGRPVHWTAHRFLGRPPSIGPRPPPTPGAPTATAPPTTGAARPIAPPRPTPTTTPPPRPSPRPPPTVVPAASQPARAATVLDALRECRSGAPGR